MKNSFVTDTMALILRLESRKMPEIIKQIFEDAENNKSKIYIPALVLAEIGYLSEKKRIDVTLTKVKNYCNQNKSIIVKDISFKTIELTFEINDIPELHDRIIAATALELNFPLLTNDSKIINSKSVSTLWK